MKKHIFTHFPFFFFLIRRYIEGIKHQEMQLRKQYMVENHYIVLILLVVIDTTVYILPDYQLFRSSQHVFQLWYRQDNMVCGPPIVHIFWNLDTEFNLVSGSIKCDGTNSWLLSKGIQWVISLIFLMVNIHCWIGEVCIYDYALNSAS